MQRRTCLTTLRQIEWLRLVKYSFVLSDTLCVTSFIQVMIWVKPFINGTLRISLSLSYPIDQQKDTWYTLERWGIKRYCSIGLLDWRTNEKRWSKALEECENQEDKRRDTPILACSSQNLHPIWKRSLCPMKRRMATFLPWTFRMYLDISTYDDLKVLQAISSFHQVTNEARLPKLLIGV